MKIEIKNLTLAFNKQKVFENLTLKFVKGTIYYLTWPSGAGKTTLFNIIAGLQRVKTGQVLVQGTLSYIFQNFNLIEELSVLENLVLAQQLQKIKKKAAVLEAQKWLVAVGLKDKEHNSVKLLSGGEKQRAVVARALITKPEIILADEPFNQLDKKNKDKLLKIFKNYYQQYKPLIIFAGQYQKLGLKAKQKIL